MLLALALAMTASPQARLDQLIAQWCSEHSTNKSATCVARQSDGLTRFQRMSSDLHDPDRALATACLRKSAAAPSLDWVAAGRCLNDAALDRFSRFRDPEQGLRPTQLPDIRWVPVSSAVR